MFTLFPCAAVCVSWRPRNCLFGILNNVILSGFRDPAATSHTWREQSESLYEKEFEETRSLSFGESVYNVSCERRGSQQLTGEPCLPKIAESSSPHVATSIRNLERATKACAAPGCNRGVTVPGGGPCADAAGAGRLPGGRGRSREVREVPSTRCPPRGVSQFRANPTRTPFQKSAVVFRGAFFGSCD